jgi:hypothetical protein
MLFLLQIYGGVPCSWLSRFNLGFLFGGPRHLPRLRDNGPLHELPYKVRTIDMSRGFSHVSVIADRRLRPRLQVWLVVGLGRHLQYQ